MRRFAWCMTALVLGCATLPLPKAKSPWERARVVPINLEALFDNDGISGKAKPADGNFDCPDHPANIPGSTYPAEHLPAGGQAFTLTAHPGVRFLFPKKRDKEFNNVVCAGQKIEVQPSRYESLWVLGAAENGDHEGTLRLNYDDGRVELPLKFPDWCAQPGPDAIVAVRSPFRYSWEEQGRSMKKEDIACHIFAVRLPTDAARVLESFNLPYNTRMHVFAISLVAAEWSEELGRQAADCVAYYARPVQEAKIQGAALRRTQARLRARHAHMQRELAAAFGREMGWLGTQLDYGDYLLRRGGKTPLPRDARSVRRLQRSIGRDLTALARGVNPFAGRKGVILKSYVSEIDGQAQPYSVRVPPTYDGRTPAALVVHLHGHGWYRPFQGHPAPAVGDAIVVSPHGRGAMDYMEVGEPDVMQVIAEVKRDYVIDDTRIYAMGHSMGGTGSWNLAVRHPDVFAAIAPNAGNADHHVWQKEWWWRHDWTPRFDKLCAFVEDACDPASYACNLMNTAVYAIHGDKDNTCPVGHTRSMVEKLNALGYDVTYKELAGVGHGGFPGRVRKEQREWLLKQRRRRAPRRVVIKTSNLRYGQSDWLRIEALQSRIGFARLEAEFVDSQSLRVAADNVARFSVDGSRLPAAFGALTTVTVNGLPARQIDTQSGFRTFAVEAGEDGPPRPGETSLRKAVGLEGPIQDVFMTPFLVVVGTTAGTETERRIVREEAGRFVADWKRLYTKPCRVKDDADVTEDDVSRYSLVLYGGPEANVVTKRIAAQLPVEFRPDGFVIGGKTYRGPNAGVKFCYPNPLNQERYVAVFAATTWRGMYQINTRFGNWFDWGVHDNRSWFDYAVFDDHTHRPDTFLCVGFFDESWRFSEEQHFEGDASLRSKALARRVPAPRVGDATGRSLYVSDLLPARINQHKGPVNFDMSFRGNPLHLGARAFRKGLGVRAPSRVDFELPPGYERFQAVVGVDMEGEKVLSPARRKSERLQFVVWDGKRRLYMSQWVNWRSKPLRIDIELEGATQLGLEVRGSGARWLLGSAAWGDARVVTGRPTRGRGPKHGMP